MLDVKLDLAGLRAAAKATPFFLRGPFIYHPVDALGRTRELWVGPQNPSFVSIEELPRYVGRAVTTSEDAGFWYHPGFDFDELKESLIDAAEGSRVRGASTLTQQLAKNLFLSRERTYARKVREALVTLALEASLPKSRLLEIYLNIIEWGPNLYGIGEASRHYFGVPAHNLSVQQAVFLATIIPNPVKYHAMYERAGSARVAAQGQEPDPQAGVERGTSIGTGLPGRVHPGEVPAEIERWAAGSGSVGKALTEPLRGRRRRIPECNVGLEIGRSGVPRSPSAGTVRDRSS